MHSSVVHQALLKHTKVAKISM